MSQHYLTPDEVGRTVFCIERIDDFPEDDYCYLHVHLRQEGQVVQKIIVYNYPPEFGESLRAMTLPAHEVSFQPDGSIGKG